MSPILRECLLSTVDFFHLEIMSLVFRGLPSPLRLQRMSPVRECLPSENVSRHSRQRMSPVYKECLPRLFICTSHLHLHLASSSVPCIFICTSHLRLYLASFAYRLQKMSPILRECLQSYENVSYLQKCLQCTVQST